MHSNEITCGKCSQIIEECGMCCDGYCQSQLHPFCVNVDNDLYVVINNISEHDKWFCNTC